MIKVLIRLLRIRFFNLIIICFIIFDLQTSFAVAQNRCISDSVINTRLKNKKLISTIEGIIFYLADRQIINRPGKRSSIFDASDLGDGARSRDELNLPFLPPIYRKVRQGIKIKNYPGEWANTIHFTPRRTGFKGKAILSVHDPNLFITTVIVYPFFLFREQSKEKFITNMLKNNWFAYKTYRRGKAYNFWPPFVNDTSLRGPANISIKRVMPIINSYTNPNTKFFWKHFLQGLDFPGTQWFSSVLNPEDNPSGINAFLNIPNDADDTSVEVAMQKIRTQLFKTYPDDDFFNNSHNFFIDDSALMEIKKYRDINRDYLKEDQRDFWKGRNSGAFLTWMADENLPIFSHPKTGVIPLGNNNVDAVLNTNALLALGLMNWKEFTGYKSAMSLVIKCIENHQWPQCGIYYPHLMIFPYSASRAYRDGNNKALKNAMPKLLKDLLNMQKNWDKKSPFRKGAFPGGMDKSQYLATAYGLNTLLNIGIKTAQEINMEADYKSAIENAVYFLLKNRKKARIKNKNTFENMVNPPKYGFRWDSGLYFASSYSDLAQWRSEAYTDAIVLEALSKYLLGYEYDTSNNIMNGKRIFIKDYSDQESKLLLPEIK